MSNKILNDAIRRKFDEFYTRLEDIEKELSYYKGFFQGKTVYCNCDDYRVSNFFRYFADNFHDLGLKTLFATCYKSQNRDIYGETEPDPAMTCVYDGWAYDIRPLRGDGDFRSRECVELLKEADIVVTNPPFSLFRKFFEQLVEYGKKFLIIGNVNGVTYNSVFKYIKDGTVTLGMTRPNWYVMDEKDTFTRHRRIDDAGRTLVNIGNARWFTNLPREAPPFIELSCRYTPEKYPKYDNYDAIEVSRTADIPCDYDGVMGVPVTFLDRHNPAQFEIAGRSCRFSGTGFHTKIYRGRDRRIHTHDLNAGCVIVDGDKYMSKYKRIFIKRVRQ